MKNKKSNPFEFPHLKFLYRTFAFGLLSTTTAVAVAQSSARPTPVPSPSPNAPVTAINDLPSAPDPQNVPPASASQAVAPSAPAPTVNINNLFVNPFVTKPAAPRVWTLNPDYLPPSPFDAYIDKNKADPGASLPINVDVVSPERHLLALSPDDLGPRKVSKQRAPHEYDVGGFGTGRSEHFLGDTQGLNDNNWGGGVTVGGKHSEYMFIRFRNSYRVWTTAIGFGLYEPIDLFHKSVSVKVGVLAGLQHGYSRKLGQDAIAPALAAGLVTIEKKLPEKNNPAGIFGKFLGADHLKEPSIALQFLGVPPAGRNATTGKNGAAVANVELMLKWHLVPKAHPR